MLWMNYTGKIKSLLFSPTRNVSIFPVTNAATPKILTVCSVTARYSFRAINAAAILNIPKTVLKIAPIV